MHDPFFLLPSRTILECLTFPLPSARRPLSSPQRISMSRLIFSPALRIRCWPNESRVPLGPRSRTGLASSPTRFFPGGALFLMMNSCRHLDHFPMSSKITGLFFSHFAPLPREMGTSFSLTFFFSSSIPEMERRYALPFFLYSCTPLPFGRKTSFPLFPVEDLLGRKFLFSNHLRCCELLLSAFSANRTPPPSLYTGSGR